jgi:hypothetical protein
MPVAPIASASTAARRAAIGNVLASEGMAEETAEAWRDAWEDEGERLGLNPASSDYWTIGLVWIHERRKTKKLPT